MTRVGRYTNAAMTIDFAPDELPRGASTEALALATPDRAATSGLLYRPAGDARSLVALMHPRVDFTRHYLIPPLLRQGHAVWAQRSRTVGNDLTAVHEQLLIDVATAHARLERLGFDHVYLLGNSGGASLYAYYTQQAGSAPEQRLDTSPSGLPVDLTPPMPMPAGLILLAPHPGQGELLLHCIDPAVADEGDPASVVPELDLFDPKNGFREPPESSSYDDDFLRRYRAAQRERVARIDGRMRELLDEQRELRGRGRDERDRHARRRALAGRFVTVHRTDADPRTVDLSLDPSDRDYGSIFGRRPDVTNYGAVGFARLTTPHAWLSTWSGISSRAALRLTAPDITVPTLLLSYTADNSVFPADVQAIEDALACEDRERGDVVGDHYGYEPGSERRSPDAADAICAWLEHRT
jgi:hypothetical protein